MTSGLPQYVNIIQKFCRSKEQIPEQSNYMCDYLCNSVEKQLSSVCALDIKLPFHLIFTLCLSLLLSLRLFTFSHFHLFLFSPPQWMRQIPKFFKRTRQMAKRCYESCLYCGVISILSAFVPVSCWNLAPSE